MNHRDWLLMAFSMFMAFCLAVVWAFIGYQMGYKDGYIEGNKERVAVQSFAQN